ncbi:hypothetical protein BH09MYX1_BH09MYX1_54130 [soil metagenome]
MRKLFLVPAIGSVVAMFTTFGGLGGCGGSDPSGFTTDAGNGDKDSGQGADAPSFDDVFTPGDGAVAPVEAGPPVEVAVVYGHSPSVLYKLDPVSKNITTVGTFSGCDGSVIDMAIDENNVGYCTTFGGFFKLDLKTAKCTSIASGSYPNSLSFVPKGTLDPNAEALVGYFGSTYAKINVQTGQIQNVGALTGGYTSSGDIVSVKNGGTFLTVKSNSCSDCLLQVDPKTGNIVQNYGTVNHTDVFGLGFWAGSVYGFTNTGELFEISANGNGIKTTNITIPNKPSGLSFYGAGSTTSAQATTADGGGIVVN